MVDQLRVGSVPYLVGRPLDLGLEDEPGIALVRRPPSELIRMLRAGELDVALCSSIELFRRPGYRYIDGLAVAGDGPVASVKLFLRRKASELRSVALDPASRTSAVLAKIVLEHRGVRGPTFFEPKRGLDPRAVEADAWLRIGDAALRETLEEPRLGALDLCAEWKRTTELPFVFAAWIVAPGVDVSTQVEAFRRSRARGAKQVAELAEEAAKSWRLPSDFCRNYLERECKYDLGAEQHRALIEFRDAAAALDEADRCLEPVAV